MIKTELHHLLLIPLTLDCFILPLTERQYHADSCSLGYWLRHRGTDVSCLWALMSLMRSHWQSYFIQSFFIELAVREKPWKWCWNDSRSGKKNPTRLSSTRPGEPSRMCWTLPRLIEANIFIVNKPRGMEFNWDEVRSILCCPGSRGENRSW